MRTELLNQGQENLNLILGFTFVYLFYRDWHQLQIEIPGVNFINILLTAFTRAEPESAKRQSSCWSFLCFWDLHTQNLLVESLWNWPQETLEPSDVLVFNRKSKIKINKSGVLQNKLDYLVLCSSWYAWFSMMKYSPIYYCQCFIELTGYFLFLLFYWIGQKKFLLIISVKFLDWRNWRTHFGLRTNSYPALTRGKPIQSKQLVIL